MHDHENCNCEEYMDITVTLTLDNDEVVECSILTIFETNGREYIALLPLDENGEPSSGDIYLYRYIEDKENEPELENIVDDDEYKAVSGAFDEWLNDQGFEESDGCE